VVGRREWRDERNVGERGETHKGGKEVVGEERRERKKTLTDVKFTCGAVWF